MDVRIEKTKAKLENALLKILRKKRIEDISVVELCAEAKVNRSTFYVYYSSVEELFDDIFGRILYDMKKELQEKKIVSLEELLRIYLKYAKENQTVFQSIHEHNINYHCIKQMTSLISGYLDKKKMQTILQNNLVFSYWYSGFFGLIKQWLENDCSNREEEIIAILTNQNN